MVMPMISIACPVWLSVVPRTPKPGRDSRSHRQRGVLGQIEILVGERRRITRIALRDHDAAAAPSRAACPSEEPASICPL